MKTKLIAAFFFFTLITYSQTTYFIKYKDHIPVEQVQEKIRQQNIFPSIQFRPLLNNEFLAMPAAGGLTSVDERLSRIIRITFASQMEENNFIQLLDDMNDIEYIQQAVKYQIHEIPNDSLVSEQWALHTIKAFDAWEITMGSDSVLVAVIDTGIDYEHPELKNKIYINPGETGNDLFGNDKRTNNLDDDRNGFIDDFMGWDFTDRVGFPFDSTGGDYLGWDNDPMDQHGHGTYIAGILAAETNNITGIAGAAPNIKILNLRAFDPSGYGEEDDVAAAILYAVSMGAKVINMSFGDNSFSYILRDVIRYAYSQNVVLISSSGNSASNLPHYPSGYSEVICVGNSTDKDFVAPSSNWGSTLDLVAPGSSILTTAPNNNYALISGTSASSPHVAATAALILSLGNYSNEEVKQIIKSTCDDIGEPGWDLRSGAGRLNMHRALSVLAPSRILFNSPRQDFTTLQDTLRINATILSAYFTSYQLLYGKGLNPNVWTTLIADGVNQFSNENIYNLPLSNLPDTSYTLRLLVNLNTGNTMEERVNFYISRKAPEAYLVTIAPAFYGEESTILAAVYSDEPAVSRMYYRQTGQNEFNFITLDGFATNNQFVKQMHYGFIPKQLVIPNTQYEIYFECENLVGLKTKIDNNGSNFFIRTENYFELSEKIEKPYSLPAGIIYQNPVNISSIDKNEIILRELNNPRVSNFYQLQNGSFTKKDSLVDQIVRDFGDFNNNGKKNILSYFVYNGYLYEQDNAGSSKFVRKYENETGEFWPIFAKDITGNNQTEIAVVKNDSTIRIWSVNNDLSLSNPTDLVNFTEKRFFGNTFNFPHGVLTDFNNDGINELWFVDRDGDIFSYKVSAPGNYVPDKVIVTDFLGSSGLITAGDYTGNGKTDLAVLLRSIDNLDIAPFYRLIVFTMQGNDLVTVFDQAFLDPTQEFRSAFQRAENSLRLFDITGDGKDELILFIYPYSYIFKYDDQKNKVISYKENINSNSVFVGDLDFNGVPEIAFPTAQGIKFYEFTHSLKPSTPYNVRGYSLDSTSVEITWYGSESSFDVYKGYDKDNLIFYGSSNTKSFIDIDGIAGNTYYYAIRSMNLSKPEPFSDLSTIVEVFAHIPARPSKVESNSSTTVTVLFSDKVNNTIENLKSFEVPGVGFPNSITPASQFSYLLTFKENLPVGNNKLIIKGLRDFYGSPIQEDTLSFVVNPVVIQNEFFVTSHEIVNSYLVKLTFNLPYDVQSILNSNNYSFEPANIVSSVSQSGEDDKTVFISLQGGNPVGSIGRVYTLRLKDIYSSLATGNIKINEGAGSYVVLTSFAENLSDVYVYPNPVRAGKGDAKVTFANLPQKTEITIWNLNGQKMQTLSSRQGIGGIDWDLRSITGEMLDSGVYIFRVVSLDDKNNELEEMIGKFAVIR